MWRELVANFPDVELHDPATDDSLADIESQLGQPIPISLRELLGETNGIDAHYGTTLVWDSEKIITENRELRNNYQLRTLYMPFDSLMFFGDNGGEDQFAFVRTPEREDVFVWDHETDSRTWVSPSLESFLGNWLASGGEDWYRQ
ncbi:hypothetical protein SALBM311S_03420 [Streptomyces alboniger]